MTVNADERRPPTRAAADALAEVSDPAVRSDLLFLADWQRNGPRGLGSMLRFRQIRRASPALIEAAIGT